MTLAYSILNLEHTGEYVAEPEVNSLTLDAMEAIVDPLLNDPKCIEQTLKLLGDLEHTDPALFKNIAEDTEGLSGMLGAGPPALPSAIQAVMNNPTAKLSKDGTGITVHDNGRLKYVCLCCGKLHDRKPRADDCRNRDLGIKPHVCRGECGKKKCNKSYALEQLLTRHWEPKNSKFTKCIECHTEVSKQNLARHMDSCMRR